MSSWLFNVYIDAGCGARSKLYRVLGKWMEMLSVNGGWFEKDQMLFPDDTAQVADSEEKLCRLVGEFGRIEKKEDS